MVETYTGSRFVSFISCTHPRIRIFRTSSPWKWARGPLRPIGGPLISTAGRLPARTQENCRFCGENCCISVDQRCGSRSREWQYMKTYRRKTLSLPPGRRVCGRINAFSFFLVLCVLLTGSRSARGPRIRVEIPGRCAYSYLIRGGFRPKTTAAPAFRRLHIRLNFD